MSEKQIVTVETKPFWESRTQIYNTFKAVAGYITALVTLFVTMQNEGTLPFDVDTKTLLFIAAFLVVTDGHVSIWLRSDTRSPIQ
jgi:hypothetical protein